MKKISTIFVSMVLLAVLTCADVFAQGFNTGALDVNLNAYGRIRIGAPTADDIQIDRMSILVATASDAVYDYKNDGDTEIEPITVENPMLSDFEIMGVYNNNYSGAAPNVLVETNVYGWNASAYAVVKFVVINNSGAEFNATIGFEVLPQIETAYGDEICEYDAETGVMMAHKTKYVGFLPLATMQQSVNFVPWSDGYSVDTDFYQWLTNGEFDASLEPGGDGAVMVMSQEPKTIPAGGREEFFVAIAYGDDKASMEQNIYEAMNKYATSLPVELTAFSADVAVNNVSLSWTTETEVNNHGFEIQRQVVRNDVASEWAIRGFIDGEGTSSESKNYSFVDDANDIDAQVLRYRLKQIDYDGSFSYSETVEVTLPPTEFALHQNFPNPFNPSTAIEYAIAQEGMVTLDIYNSIGENVATLLNKQHEAGNYKVTFNAASLPNGIYFYTLHANGNTITKKMMLVK